MGPLRTRLGEDARSRVALAPAAPDAPPEGARADDEQVARTETWSGFHDHGFALLQPDCGSRTL
jgi:hypothetical protein